MFVDYHVHSNYSDDSTHEMEDVVKDAIEMGIAEICFTDHVDYGVKPDAHEEVKRYYKGIAVTNVNYPKYFKEISYLQEKYKGQIVIKKGLEFGVQLHTIDKYQTLFERYPMDFVLLSIHQINDQEFWLQEYQKNKTIQEIYDGYYDEMYSVIKNYHHFSCLAHMDLIRRYLEDTTDNYESTKDKIDIILRHCIKHNKGIEINTSHVRYGIDGYTPSLHILKRYHELGGKIITIGSDSHMKSHLGFYVHEAKALLKEIGFEYFCTFDKMKPIFHKL